MSWNYRVLAFVQEDETVLKVCEVHYNAHDKPRGYVDKGILISTEGKKGLRWILNKCKQALEKPILYGGDKFPQEYTKSS